MTLQESYLFLSDKELYKYVIGEGKPDEFNYIYDVNPSLALERYYSISKLVYKGMSREEILSMSTEQRITYRYLLGN